MFEIKINTGKTCEKCGSTEAVKKVRVSSFNLSQSGSKYLCARCANIEKLKKY